MHGFYFLLLLIFPKMNTDTFIAAFFIYSILGYLCEVAYCSIPQHRFVNRGFLYGPYLPIYGFGEPICHKSKTKAELNNIIILI